MRHYRASGFVLPLGATVNMDGTALYECVAAIPSASLVAIAIILAAVGLPVEAIRFTPEVDRVLNMCRTAVNVYSDSCGAMIIAHINGGKTCLASRPCCKPGVSRLDHTVIITTAWRAELSDTSPA